jgi:hypothetical protein
MARDKIKDLRRRVYLVLEQGPVGDELSLCRDPRIARRIEDVVDKRVGREVVGPKGDIVTEEIAPAEGK